MTKENLRGNLPLEPPDPTKAGLAEDQTQMWDLFAKLREESNYATQLDSEGASVARQVRLRAIREAAGLTQNDMAEALGISQEAVSALERGNSPKLPSLARYLNVLGAELNVTARGADGTIIELAYG